MTKLRVQVTVFFIRPSVIDHFYKTSHEPDIQNYSHCSNGSFSGAVFSQATAPLVESPNVTETPPPTQDHPIPVRVLAICRAMTATKQRPPLFCTKTK